MCTVGRLRSLHADCRPVGTTRPSWGQPSGLWRPSNGQPTWPSHPCCVPWSGVDTGGTGPGPQGCTRCPTDAAWFRGGGLRLSPPPVFTHYHNLQMRPLSPLQFILVLARTNRIGPGHAYFCPLSPLRGTAAARRPGDRSPWFAASGTCFLAVLFPGPLSKLFPQYPLRSRSFLFTNAPPLSRASERATSINYRASSCCIYVIEPAGHQVPCSHLMGGVLPEIVSCIIDLSSSLLSPTGPGSPDQRTMVGGLIRFLIPF